MIRAVGTVKTMSVIGTDLDDRQVTMGDASEYAKENGLTYYEVSAK